MQRFLAESKIDIFLHLNNVTLQQYQEFLVLRDDYHRRIEEQLRRLNTTQTPTATPTTTEDNTSTTPATTDDNTSTTQPNNESLIVSNFSQNTKTTSTTNHSIRVHNITTNLTPITTTLLPTLATFNTTASIGLQSRTTGPTTTTTTNTTQNTTTTPDPFSVWADKIWIFPAGWVPYNNSLTAENQSSPWWYTKNKTFPEINKAEVANTIDFNTILNNMTDVIGYMQSTNLFGKCVLH